MGKTSRKNAKHLQREMNIPKEELKHFPLVRLAQRIALKDMTSINTPMLSSIMGKTSRKNAKHLQREMNIPKEELKHFPLVRLAQKIALKGMTSINTPMLSSIMRRMAVQHKICGMRMGENMKLGNIFWHEERRWKDSHKNMKKGQHKLSAESLNSWSRV